MNDGRCGGDQLGEFWYRDKETLLNEYAAHGSVREMARVHGMSNSTISEWWSRLGIPKIRPGPKTFKTDGFEASPERAIDERVLQAIDKLGNKANIAEIADFVDASPRKVRHSLDRLTQRGHRLEIEALGDSPGDTTVTILKVPPPDEKTHEILFGGNDYRFAIVSDVHLGSKEEMLEELHVAYDRIASEGIDTVYNPGDLVCGIGIYRGQVNDIKFHTYRDQVDYATENYPCRPGVTTRIIAGNHDLEGDAAKIGANPVIAVCNNREDMIYDGDYSAWYTLPQGTSIYVVHPKGGGSYARSYKLQKFAESFEGGRKPNVLISGHYHDAMYLPNERGIQMLKAGTFEGGGSLGLRLPLRSPMTGFWIVDMTVGEDGSVVRFRPEWFPFYPGRKVAVAV